MFMEMYIPPRENVIEQVKAPYIFDSKIADVTGDQVVDFIYLAGDKESPEAIHQEHIMLYIVDGVTNEVIEQTFPSNSGYGAHLFVGDFNNNYADDVMVSIDSGGSGAMGYYYIYSFLNKEPKQLFDYESFNQAFRWEVKFLDQYRVEVKNTTLNQTFYLDIKQKDNELINRYYQLDGKAINNKNGMVLPLSGVYPIKTYKISNTFDLMTSQRIIGEINVDTVGLVNIYLTYDNNQFVPYEVVIGDYQFIQK